MNGKDYHKCVIKPINILDKASIRRIIKKKNKRLSLLSEDVDAKEMSYLHGQLDILYEILDYLEENNYDKEVYHG